MDLILKQYYPQPPQGQRLLGEKASLLGVYKQLVTEGTDVLRPKVTVRIIEQEVKSGITKGLPR